MQPGPDVLDEPGERVGVPGGAAGLVDQAVDGAVDAVGEQGGDGAVRVVGQDELLRVVRRFATSLAGDLTASRTSRRVPARMARRGGGGGLEQADVDGGAGVDERRVGLDLAVGEDLRQRAEVPAW